MNKDIFYQIGKYAKEKHYLLICLNKMDNNLITFSIYLVYENKNETKIKSEIYKITIYGEYLRLEIGEKYDKEDSMLFYFKCVSPRDSNIVFIYLNESKSILRIVKFRDYSSSNNSFIISNYFSFDNELFNDNIDITECKSISNSSCPTYGILITAIINKNSFGYINEVIEILRERFDNINLSKDLELDDDERRYIIKNY